MWYELYWACKSYPRLMLGTYSTLKEALEVLFKLRYGLPVVADWARLEARHAPPLPASWKTICEFGG